MEMWHACSRDSVAFAGFAGVEAMERAAKNRGAAAGWKVSRRLESGNDGAWRDGVHTPPTAMPALPGGEILPGAATRRPPEIPGKKKKTGDGGNCPCSSGDLRCARTNAFVAASASNTRRE